MSGSESRAAACFHGGLVVVCLLVSRLAGAHPEIEAQLAGLNVRITDEPSNADLLLKRGELYRIHQDWVAAEADFVRAREVAPDLALVDFMLGQLMLDSRRPADARPLLDRFVAREPDHVPGRIARGRALAQLGLFLAAARDFSHALGRFGPADPPPPEYYLERGQALFAAGPEHLAEARRGIDEGLARLGEPVTLQLYAIDLDLASGRTEAALARLDRITASATRRESWYARRGEILEAAGRRDEARQAFEAALASLSALPPARRDNRAAQKLREQAEAALIRLAETR